MKTGKLKEEEGGRGRGEEEKEEEASVFHNLNQQEKNGISRLKEIPGP